MYLIEAVILNENLLILNFFFRNLMMLQFKIKMKNIGKDANNHMYFLQAFRCCR